jgi:ketosteroid isomerase-like protein
MNVIDETDDKGAVVTEDMMRLFVEAFNRHDLDAIMTFFTDDCSFDLPKGPHPYGMRFVGKSAVREGIASRFKDISNAHWANDRNFVSASGDRGVSEWLVTGTSRAGERIEVRGCDLFEFNKKDGKVKRKDTYWKIVQP